MYNECIAFDFNEQRLIFDWHRRYKYYKQYYKMVVWMKLFWNHYDVNVNNTDWCKNAIDFVFSTVTNDEIIFKPHFLILINRREAKWNAEIDRNTPGIFRDWTPKIITTRVQMNSCNLHYTYCFWNMWKVIFNYAVCKKLAKNVYVGQIRLFFLSFYYAYWKKLGE